VLHLSGPSNHPRMCHKSRFLAHIAILWTIGIILVVIGLILYVLGMAGRAVGGRKHYY